MKVLYPGETEPMNFPSIFTPQPLPSDSTNSQISTRQPEGIDLDHSANNQSTPPSQESSPRDQVTRSPSPDLPATHASNELDITLKATDTTSIRTQKTDIPAHGSPLPPIPESPQPTTTVTEQIQPPETTNPPVHNPSTDEQAIILA
ncbi:hypothetical protein ACSBR2_029054 [Camellia fascicularis]